jgi:predicted Zn-ribbon and HTH transcriptional regulator
MLNQDGIMQHLLELVSEGAGMALPGEVETALRKRYQNWIAAKKRTVPTSPMDVWEAKEGLAIQERLREVGRTLKRKSGTLALSTADVAACCLQVEAASECPHCPDPPSG